MFMNWWVEKDLSGEDVPKHGDEAQLLEINTTEVLEID
jgi:hypothetical protein